MTEEISNSRMGRKAKTILNRLLEGRQITQDGVRWLVQATDPFCDQELTPVGHPDKNAARSVVRCVRKNAILQKPGSLAAGAWDARVDALPYYVPGLTSQNYTIGNYPTSGGLFVGLHSPVAVSSGPVGYNISGAASAVPDNRWALTSGDLADMDRIVGIGFEVHNVTAELTKCGQVQCWRLNDAKQTTDLLSAAGPPAQYILADWSRIPNNTSQISSLPDSVAWEAKEGCYVVGTLNSEENEFSGPNFRKIILSQNGPGFAGDVGLGVPGANGLQRRFHFNPFGAYFSGLGDDSTLSITVKYFIESAPTPGSVLTPLSRPTCPYDPVIFEIYDRVMRELPVGVMVKENPFGEWLDDICGMVEKIAPTISGLGIPVVSQIASMAKPIASGVRKAMGTKQSKKAVAAATATKKGK
jgi:hypothetical protein